MQRRVISLMAQGYTMRQTAERLRTTSDSVKGHVFRSRALLGAENSAHAVAIAVSLGIVDKVPPGPKRNYLEPRFKPEEDQETN